MNKEEGKENDLPNRKVAESPGIKKTKIKKIAVVTATAMIA